MRTCSPTRRRRSRGQPHGSPRRCATTRSPRSCSPPRAGRRLHGGQPSARLQGARARCDDRPGPGAPPFLEVLPPLGWTHTGQTLADREFRCGGCGLVLDRDVNAALNIKLHARPEKLKTGP
ncbi:zinc ribbon domain-containing protein [Streptomyces lavendulae]|uniref:zinc ribbon domain-containing protein n=1 Tax=Streptomyces lavendulae TaxID=1914 RepID=UPI0036E1A448